MPFASARFYCCTLTKISARSLICCASSLVGASTRHRGSVFIAPAAFAIADDACMSPGSTYAIVLPEPVAATPIMSAPVSRNGRHCAWIGVGFL